jgi:hypothetical protein
MGKRAVRKFSLTLFILAATLASVPAALADAFYYNINGQNFSADLTFTATAISGKPGDYTITGVTGWFSDPDTNGAVTLSSSNPATVISAGGAFPPNYANEYGFQYDNVLYATATGNGILDWGGLLFSTNNGYMLNIFSDSTNGNAGYFYFADNGTYYVNTPISTGTYGSGGSSGGSPPPASGGLTSSPEPGTLLLLGTGLLGLAVVIFRKPSLQTRP